MEEEMEGRTVAISCRNATMTDRPSFYQRKRLFPGCDWHFWADRSRSLPNSHFHPTYAYQTFSPSPPRYPISALINLLPRARMKRGAIAAAIIFQGFKKFLFSKSIGIKRNLSDGGSPRR